MNRRDGDDGYPSIRAIHTLHSTSYLHASLVIVVGVIGQRNCPIIISARVIASPNNEYNY